MLKGQSLLSCLSRDPITEWDTSLVVKGTEMKIPARSGREKQEPLSIKITPKQKL